MFELKKYQSETLQILREFLEEARLMPVEEAFTRAQQRQNRAGFLRCRHCQTRLSGTRLPDCIVASAHQRQEHLPTT